MSKQLIAALRCIEAKANDGSVPPSGRLKQIAAIASSAVNAETQWPYGVSRDETYSRLPSGIVLAFPSFRTNSQGVDYIRFLNDRGGEVGYWASEEWEEEAISVMGAICGLIVMESDPANIEYYYFSPDCEFPEGVNPSGFEPSTLGVYVMRQLLKKNANITFKEAVNQLQGLSDEDWSKAVDVELKERQSLCAEVRNMARFWGDDTEVGPQIAAL